MALHCSWFPKGLDEPDIALLKVVLLKAEYWSATKATPAASSPADGTNQLIRDSMDTIAVLFFPCPTL